MTSPTPSTTKVELSLSKNFFIWGNIILMAFIPWLLTQSMAGLAVGDSVFPAWFEISLLGLPAIALVTWLQWIQPISPFSLWLIAKPTEKLNEQERRALTLVSQKKNGWYVTGWIAIAMAIFMSAVFCKIYADSPLSQVIAPFPDQLRFFGVLWAEVFFLLSNVLLQSGVSALRVRLTADSDLIDLPPFAPEKIKDSFTHIGWRSPQFLTGDQTGDQVDSTLDVITPDTLTEEITDAVEDQKLEISDLVENEAVDELLQEKELEVNDIAEDFTETAVVQESFAENADAENPDIVTEILPELGIENTSEQPAFENALQTQTEEVSEELEINDEESAVEEVFAEIKADKSLDVADNFSELVTDEIESEEIESELVSEEILVDEIESEEIESELVPEEILVDEIESEQLISVGAMQITDSNQTDVLANLEIADPAPDEKIGEEIETVEELEISEEAIKKVDIGESSQEIIDSTDSDFENKLDELIAFNLYVENILQDYLEEDSADDATNDNDTNNDGVVDITELTATSETATVIAEEVLIAEEILEEGIPEAVEDQSTLKIPDQETDKNLSVVESQEKSKSPQEPKQSPKYLVEEFLVDKYLAKLEQLNKAEKNEQEKDAPKETNSNVIEPKETKLDGLDELIDGKSMVKD